MNLTYTLDEMIKALEKAGYECKLEKEIDSSYSVDREYFVWNAYYKGNKMMEIEFSRLSGTERLQRIFRYEVQKRILNLF